jgi:elongation factor Ts
MSISAQQVKELRDRTTAKMMDCKKALVEADGDMEKAVEILRTKSQSSADKKAAKVTGDGIVVVKTNSDGKSAVLLEVNSQTDFVARDASFVAFANEVAEVALTNNVSDLAKLGEQALSNGQGVDQFRVDLVAKLGENIHCRRVALFSCDGSDQFVASYVHQAKIGVLVKLEGGDESVARDMAMHVAASSPLVIDPSEVPQDLVNKEKEIFIAQAKESGKPDDIIEKMVQGRISKFLNEQSLVGQAFVKDPSTKVGKVLDQAKAKVVKFEKFVVGEGIEKEEDDFAKEVMEQAFGKK